MTSILWEEVRSEARAQDFDDSILCRNDEGVSQIECVCPQVSWKVEFKRTKIKCILSMCYFRKYKLNEIIKSNNDSFWIVWNTAKYSDVQFGAFGKR